MLTNLNRKLLMAKRDSVPTAVTDRRQDGAVLERAFRERILALEAQCRIKPFERFLHDALRDGRPMTSTQLFSAFAAIARCPELPEASVDEAAETFCALMKALRPSPERCLTELHVAETEAQCAADVSQLHATLSGGKDRGALEHTLKATTSHVVALNAVREFCAAKLIGFVPSPRFMGRRA